MGDIELILTAQLNFTFVNYLLPTTIMQDVYNLFMNLEKTMILL